MATLLNNKYQDIQISDETLFNQFKIAWGTNDFSTAFNIIENNPQLNTKSLVALVINSLNENLTDLQNMNDPAFKSDKIEVSVTPPVDLQTGEVYFEII